MTGLEVHRGSGLGLQAGRINMHKLLMVGVFLLAGCSVQQFAEGAKKILSMPEVKLIAVGVAEKVAKDLTHEFEKRDADRDVRNGIIGIVLTALLGLVNRRLTKGKADLWTEIKNGNGNGKG